MLSTITSIGIGGITAIFVTLLFPIHFVTGAAVSSVRSTAIIAECRTVVIVLVGFVLIGRAALFVSRAIIVVLIVALTAVLIVVIVAAIKQYTSWSELWV